MKAHGISSGDLFRELPMSAQHAYAELAEQTQSLELQSSLAGLKGSFHKRDIKGKSYWYFGYRDIDGKVRMAYIGPDSERVRHAVDRISARAATSPVAGQTGAAIALGCTPALARHFRIIRRLAEYGLFRAGGVLIGTHAFVALGNMLGVRWLDSGMTLDIDFAHAGRNISLALPTSIRIDVHGALQSLEMGLLPLMQFNGKVGAQYRNPDDPELRLDFVTCQHRKGGTVAIPNLNVALEPLKFMEFSLESTVQGCVLGDGGACIVNLPAPERFAIHKLIVHGERPASQQTKARKDLMQAAALIAWLAGSGRGERVQAAWDDAISRGRNWERRLVQGRAALVRTVPELAMNLPLPAPRLRRNNAPRKKGMARD